LRASKYKMNYGLPNTAVGDIASSTTSMIGAYMPVAYIVIGIIAGAFIAEILVDIVRNKKSDVTSV